MIGMWLSMQRVRAVLSITVRPRLSTSRYDRWLNRVARGVSHRVGGVDAVHLGGLEQHVGADLGGAECRGGVGGEERAAVAPGQDHHPPLLQVADRPQRDEGLGHLLHGDGALHPALHPQALDRVAQAERVDDRGQHPHVVAGDPLDAVAADVGAPDDVAAAHHDGQLDAPGDHPPDLAGDQAQRVHVDPVGLAPDQGLTGELEHEPREDRAPPVRLQLPGGVHAGGLEAHVLAASAPPPEVSPTW